MYNRYLTLDLSQGQSAFLWGARKTGKSTFLKTLFPDSARFDLLNNEIRLKYLKEPWKFRLEVLKLDPLRRGLPIIVDEMQKAPAILDEIHSLIEDEGCYFILCGSSARQMRRTGINMLGGRAIKYNFYPLVYPEIKDDFDLLKIFNNGLIPVHYLSKDASRSLRAYIEDYLLYEIQAEGLARNLDMFSRFLDSVVFSHGECINYSNIARDVGINGSTVREYYQILVDTLMGHLVYPYSKKVGREIIASMPKFYLFDVGVANKLLQRSFKDIKGIEAGRSLEHYIFTELVAYIGLNNLDHKISYWRTKTGLEVDFIVYLKNGSAVPIEIKISENLHKTELKGIKAFMREHEVQVGYVVCMEPRAQKYIVDEGEIVILPVFEFLEDLWNKKIF